MLSVKTKKPKVAEYLLHLYIHQLFIWQIIMRLLLDLCMSILFVSAKNDKSVQNLLEVCSRLLATFTILQTGMCSFEFYCHYPP